MIQMINSEVPSMGLLLSLIFAATVAAAYLSIWLNTYTGRGR